VDSAIECRSLKKILDGRAVVDDLSFSVESGHIFGFLGPNGAGKTTTIRMLLGLARPTSGTALVLGREIPPGPLIQSAIGGLVEEPAAYPWMTGRRFLRVVLASGLRQPESLADEALERVELADAAEKPIKTYSQGMRQRLGLAVALLRRPQLLILDEPANGLDPAGTKAFRDILETLREDGCTVFLSSHQLSEIEKLCDRIAIINQGRLVREGTVEEIVASESKVRVRVDPSELERARVALEHLDVFVDDGGELLVRATSGREVSEALAARNVYPEAVRTEFSSLEERFLELTQEERT
jgi:ABC-type multidrug transport system ATPase subunit